MIEINLLPTTGLLSSKEIGLKRQVSLVVVVLSVLVFLEVLFFFATKLVLNSSIDGLTNTAKTIQKSLDQYSQVATDLRTVTEKLVGVQAVRADRNDYLKLATKLQSVFDGDTELVSLQVDQNGVTSILASAPTGDAVGQFISRFNALNKPEVLFKDTVISGLRQEIGGNFSFRLTSTYDFKK